MAVHLTDEQYLVFNQFLDDVFARLKAGQITEGAAQAEINDAIAKIEGQPGAIEAAKLRELVQMRANA